MSTVAVWVVGAYKGEMAKKVLAHASEGLGYKIMQQSGRGTNLEVLAAFRCPQPLPLHLTEITDPIKIAKLEGRLLSK